MTDNGFFKGLLIVGGVALLFCLACLFLLFGAFPVFQDTARTKEDLIKNYSQRKVQILELKKYFNSIVPKGKQVEIEFESDRKLFRFGVTTIDTTTGETEYPGFLAWDLETSSDRVDSVISLLGWTQGTLQTLKEKLDNADCIEVESGEPAKIGWQRSGMGMYFYNIFDKPVADSLKPQYMDSCTYILYNEKVVLEYGGGAIGVQCFTGK